MGLCLEVLGDAGSGWAGAIPVRAAAVTSPVASAHGRRREAVGAEVCVERNLLRTKTAHPSACPAAPSWARESVPVLPLVPVKAPVQAPLRVGVLCAGTCSCLSLLSVPYVNAMGSLRGEQM